MRLHLSQREHNVPELVIGKLLKIANEDKSVISLGPGEPDFSLPKPLVEAVKRYSDKSNHYSPPEGFNFLREAIAKKLLRENKILTTSDNVVVTNGSQEGFLIALNSILDPKDKIVVPSPSYMDYIPPIEMVNATPLQFKLDFDDNFLINPDRLESFVKEHKPRALVINTPSNPTGSVYSKKQLEEIADIANEYGLYVLSDEAYEKIIYDKKHVSFESLSGVDEIAITLQSFSKTFAMCGFRLGYVNGSREVIDSIKKLKLHTSITSSSISQYVGLEALKMDKKYVDRMVDEYKRRRDYIVPRLNELGLKTNVPEGAFYAFSSIRHLPINSFKFAERMLKEAKVAVVPGTEFGHYGEGFVRFSYATDYKLIKEGLDSVEKWMRKNNYL